jgi:hypothetical protein
MTIIEAGWRSLKAASVDPDAPTIQLEEMRNAFFAGAQHVFSSVVRTDKPDHEMAATLQAIDAELAAFIEDHNVRHGITEPPPAPDHTLGDAPIEKDYIAQMTAIMQTVDDFMNNGKRAPHKEIGIVILTFKFGDTNGRCNFMSNGADRRDIVALFKEMIGRFESQSP